jgi:hypothetical protein
MRLHNSGQSCIKPRIEKFSSLGVRRAKAANPLSTLEHANGLPAFLQSNRWVATI